MLEAKKNTNTSRIPGKMTLNDDIFCDQETIINKFAKYFNKVYSHSNKKKSNKYMNNNFPHSDYLSIDW